MHTHSHACPCPCRHKLARARSRACPCAHARTHSFRQNKQHETQQTERERKRITKKGQQEHETTIENGKKNMRSKITVTNINKRQTGADKQTKQGVGRRVPPAAPLEIWRPRDLRSDAVSSHRRGRLLCPKHLARRAQARLPAGCRTSLFSRSGDSIFPIRYRSHAPKSAGCWPDFGRSWPDLVKVRPIST